MTIDELKQQRRWVLWRLETVNGKQTKVPYQPSGRKAMANNPDTWHTYADLGPHVSKFSGIGLILGEVDGVYVWGVDIDRCCDASTQKFTPESRLAVIELDSYTEYSPSGTGCHVWGIGKLFGPGLQKPYPGAKQIEVKGNGYYQTFTGRHIGKTPAVLEDRQEQITALYNRVSTITPRKNQSGLGVSIPVSEEERFQKLWAGDMSAYDDNHSAADFALCILLAKKHGCNAFKIDAEFRKSALYRDKWERDDYRENTITRAILAVAKDTPVIFAESEEERMEDDGTDEYLVEALSAEHEGWFPKADISLVGGSSGTGKTYWVMTVLEKVRNALEVWGHKTKARDYRVLMLDRGAKAMRRTLNKMGLSAEAKQRVIRVTSAQQSAGPVAVLTAATEREPGAEAWFIEGLDMWLKEAGKMSEVANVLDELQRLATRRNVSIIASVGSSKEKTAEGRDTERYRGRDTIFGSVAWGRKSETIVLISKTDNDPLHDDCPRQYSVLVRNGRSEHFWMDFHAGELRMVDRPEPREREHKGPPSKAGLVRLNVLARFKPGERVTYSPELGVSEKTYYSWARRAVADNVLEQRIGQDGYFVPVAGTTATAHSSSSNT
ncbi:MAG TPA: hypothetical protein VHV29_02130 [Terriglobales bacterium]|jgi:hypothetical protein|nr:hypothetical protein [Terriglobales bacterium]